MSSRFDLGIRLLRWQLKQWCSRSIREREA